MYLTKSNRESLISALKIATKIAGRDGIVSINFANGVVTGNNQTGTVIAGFVTDPWEITVEEGLIVSPEIILGGSWAKVAMGILIKAQGNTVEFSTLWGIQADTLAIDGEACSFAISINGDASILCVSATDVLTWTYQR